VLEVGIHDAAVGGWRHEGAALHGRGLVARDVVIAVAWIGVEFLHAQGARHLDAFRGHVFDHFPVIFAPVQCSAKQGIAGLIFIRWVEVDVV